MLYGAGEWQDRLLRTFSRKPHLYFQAAQVSDRDNLRQFLQEAAEATGDAFLARADFADRETPLEYLAKTTKRRLIVVLDEFPYLCEANPSLPSLLQRFWDQYGSAGRLMLVLCGSSISFMEQEVLAERSPLFGRRTGQLELLPLGYREAAVSSPGTRLSSGFSLRDLGGMPMSRCSSRTGFGGCECARHLFDSFGAAV